MNAVEFYIFQTHERAVVVMNELQARGVVSDNCVGPEDVAGADGMFVWGALGLREFALLKSCGWVTDSYGPEQQSWPQPWREKYKNQNKK